MRKNFVLLREIPAVGVFESNKISLNELQLGDGEEELRSSA